MPRKASSQSMGLQKQDGYNNPNGICVMASSCSCKSPFSCKLEGTSPTKPARQASPRGWSSYTIKGSQVSNASSEFQKLPGVPEMALEIPASHRTPQLRGALGWCPKEPDQHACLLLSILKRYTYQSKFLRQSQLSCPRTCCDQSPWFHSCPPPPSASAAAAGSRSGGCCAARLSFQL